MTSPLHLAVLISGSGSNLQAVIDQIENGQLNAEITLVISNRADAYGLERAKKAGIPTKTLPHNGYASREEYDAELIKAIDATGAELIVLAGFMRILSTAFVEHYAGRLINIHPSLLPAYKGLNTHQRVLDAGEEYHGVSVHFVTPELDAGPVIIQSRIRIQPDDTAESLQQRIHTQEHIIYPRAISWFGAGRLQIEDGEVLLDGGKSTEQFVDAG